jgi:hypothetical protein
MVNVNVVNKFSHLLDSSLTEQSYFENGEGRQRQQNAQVRVGDLATEKMKCTPRAEQSCAYTSAYTRAVRIRRTRRSYMPVLCARLAMSMCVVGRVYMSRYTAARLPPHHSVCSWVAASLYCSQNLVFVCRRVPSSVVRRPSPSFTSKLALPYTTEPFLYPESRAMHCLAISATISPSLACNCFVNLFDMVTVFYSFHVTVAAGLLRFGTRICGRRGYTCFDDALTMFMLGARSDQRVTLFCMESAASGAVSVVQKPTIGSGSGKKQARVKLSPAQAIVEARARDELLKIQAATSAAMRAQKTHEEKETKNGQSPQPTRDPSTSARPSTGSSRDSSQKSMPALSPSPKAPKDKADKRSPTPKSKLKPVVVPAQSKPTSVISQQQPTSRPWSQQDLTDDSPFSIAGRAGYQSQLGPRLTPFSVDEVGPVLVRAPSFSLDRTYSGIHPCVAEAVTDIKHKPVLDGVVELVSKLYIYIYIYIYIAECRLPFDPFKLVFHLLQCCVEWYQRLLHFTLLDALNVFIVDSTGVGYGQGGTTPIPRGARCIFLQRTTRLLVLCVLLGGRYRAV